MGGFEITRPGSQKSTRYSISFVSHLTMRASVRKGGVQYTLRHWFGPMSVGHILNFIVLDSGERIDLLSKGREQ